MQLIDPTAAKASPAERCRTLERGNILYFPAVPFEITADDRAALLGSAQAGGSLHKNVSYRPAQDKVAGLGKKNVDSDEKVRASLRNFSRAAVQFVSELLPAYPGQWRIDYASFRGLEEKGRDLSWKKRNDLLHTDAFPTRPTNGDLILRFFVNINPAKERVWITSDPFARLAPHHAESAGLKRLAGRGFSPARSLRRAAHAIGLPVIDRSPYDRFMLNFHDYLKRNERFQRDCPKYRFDFPPGSAWMVFTDMVPHSVLSGQYALEQTFIVSRDSLVSNEFAPVTVLEKLAGQRLTY